MSNDMTEYLEELHGEISLGQCAGRIADISALHHNRLVEIDGFIRAVNRNIELAGRDTFDDEFLKSLREFEVVERQEFKPDHVFDELDKFSLRGTTDSHLERRKFLRLAVHIRDYLLEHQAREEGNLERDMLVQSIDLMEIVQKKTQQVHVIYGDPGFGKTIHLQQFTEKFVSSERINSTNTLPLFFKAKTLAESIRDHCNSSFTINYDEEEANPMEGIRFGTEDELQKTLSQAMRTRIPYLELETSNNVLKEETSRLYIIDALDECHKNDLLNVVKFMSEISKNKHTNIIATCRNSHATEINSMWNGMRDKSKIIFHEYHIDFTKKELRQIMPRKLTAAWKISGHRMESLVDEKYKEYELVLTHPLFVGIFARLLTDKDSFEGFESLSNSELVAGSYTLRHVDFLDRVITMGIELQLKERPIQGVVPQRFREVFEAVAYAYSNYREVSNSIEALTQSLALEFGFHCSDLELKALKLGVGLLYSTDGVGLEWVHKTLYEIATARFCFSKSNGFFIEQPGRMGECFKLAMIFYNMNKYNLSEDEAILHLVGQGIEQYHGRSEIYPVRAYLSLHSAWNVELIKSVKKVDGRYNFTPTASGKTHCKLFEQIVHSITIGILPSLPVIQLRNCLKDIAEHSRTDVVDSEKMVCLELITYSRDFYSTCEEIGILPFIVEKMVLGLNSFDFQKQFESLNQLRGLISFIGDDRQKHEDIFDGMDTVLLIESVLVSAIRISFWSDLMSGFAARMICIFHMHCVEIIVQEAVNAKSLFPNIHEYSSEGEKLGYLMENETGIKLIRRVLKQTEVME